MADEYFDPEKNKIYIGNTNKLTEWLQESNDQKKVIEKLKLLIKNYLELDNVSFLSGSGTSVHLGAVAIRHFPLEIEEYIKKKKSEYHQELIATVEILQFSNVEEWNRLSKSTIPEDQELIEEWKKWVEFDSKEKVLRIKETKEIEVEFEKVLNYLNAKNYLLDADKSKKRTDYVDELIVACKEGLFDVVDVDTRNVPKWLLDKKKSSKFKNQNEHFNFLTNESKYIFHEKFIKALLQRPLNLRRANIFTLNYDLAFEYAFDSLGVLYIDGFAGFHKRCFKPETFEYDVFYPGSTTAGKVQRIEKVVRYFKLHGSISWISSELRDSSNLYGIEELPLPLIDSASKKGEIIIYPNAVKKSYTLDLPYSELFRQFAATISQTQSVLCTIGYAFNDEHLNDIIFQSLSNPSFTLIIVDYTGTLQNKNIERIKDLDDSRIIIIEGEYFGDFLTFSNTIMPDFYDISSDIKIATTLNGYFKHSKDTDQEAK